MERRCGVDAICAKRCLLFTDGLRTFAIELKTNLHDHEDTVNFLSQGL